MWLFLYWINSHSYFLDVNLCLNLSMALRFVIKKSYDAWTEKSPVKCLATHFHQFELGTQLPVKTSFEEIAWSAHAISCHKV